jgi:hypothetical protein
MNKRIRKKLRKRALAGAPVYSFTWGKLQAEDFARALNGRLRAMEQDIAWALGLGPELGVRILSISPPRYEAASQALGLDVWNARSTATHPTQT